MAVPYTGVPTVAAEGGGGTPMGTHATPESFGAGVGQAVEKAGSLGVEVAMKQQGILNETLMTNADADFATKLGQLKSNFTSKTGLAAYNYYNDSYQKEIKQAFQETRATLPPAAQRGFDMLAARSMANHIADGSSYATSQLKEQRVDDYSNVRNDALQALLHPNVAANPQRVQEHLDTIKFATQAMMDEDHPGITTHPETGKKSFDENTPEGQRGKAQLQKSLDDNIGQAQVNRFTTLGTHDPMGAWSLYQDERGSVPRSAQVSLDSYFAPKIFDSNKQTAVSNTLTHAANDHFEALTNPNHSIDTVLKNEGGMSPDGHAIYGIDKAAHPTEFAHAASLPEDEGRAYARKFYKAEYYDKRGIAELPPETQDIVMDGVVNHSKAFGDKLVQAAKDGASPQQLIEMRHTEYQRLADSDVGYEQYLKGWNNRLDSFQQSTEGKKTYATNENGGPMTTADYYRTHSNEILARGDEYAEQQMPGDLALKRAVRQSLSNEMSRTISNEHAQQVMDNRNVMRAINGQMTQGNPPQTEDELRAIPGMGDLLDKVAAQDPRFAETIPTMIAKHAKRNDTTNSPNGYDTVLRTLEPNDWRENPNRIANVDHLARLLGRKDNTGISLKDYSDAKQAIELDDGLKKVLSDTMKEITNANGNLDGKGQQRALQWYNQSMAAWKENQALGDKGMDATAFAESIGEKYGPPMPDPPSRMQQLSSWAESLFKSKEQEIPSFASPDDAGFAQLPSGAQFKTSDGQIRTKK